MHNRKYFIAHHKKAIRVFPTFFFLSLIFFPLGQIIAAPTQIALPNMGDAASGIMSAEEERQLGEEFMLSVRQTLKIEDDAASTEYLQHLGERLISQIDDYDGGITLFIVKDPSINAFAGPGGYIGVHTGLILAAESEGELASVIAHEIAHITQRHLLRAFEADSKMGLPTLAAIIAAIVAGGSNPQISEAVIASTVAGSTQKTLTYSRLYEQEADRVGIQLLAKADYDPRTMVSFFEKLQQQNRYADNRLPEFLLTHPLTFSRVADARHRAEQYSKTHQNTDDLGFSLFQARIAFLSQDRAGQQPTREHLSPQANAFRLALKYRSEGNFEQADSLLQKLCSEEPSRLFYWLTQGENALAAGKLEHAKSVLSRALSLFPQNTPLTLLLAETYKQRKEIEPAYELLTAHLQSAPPSAEVYEAHAQVAQILGKHAETFRSLAEAQILLGNPHQAIDYLERALQDRHISPYQRLALEARLRDIKQQQLNQRSDRKESVTN